MYVISHAHTPTEKKKLAQNQNEKNKENTNKKTEKRFQKRRTSSLDARCSQQTTLSTHEKLPRNAPDIPNVG